MPFSATTVVRGAVRRDLGDVNESAGAAWWVMIVAWIVAWTVISVLKGARIVPEVLGAAGYAIILATGVESLADVLSLRPFHWMQPLVKKKTSNKLKARVGMYLPGAAGSVLVSIVVLKGDGGTAWGHWFAIVSCCLVGWTGFAVSALTTARRVPQRRETTKVALAPTLVFAIGLVDSLILLVDGLTGWL